MLLLLASCWLEQPQAPEVPEEENPRSALVVEGTNLDADLKRARAFLDQRPREERPIHVTGFESVEGLPNLSAETCASCHAEIAQEWRNTIHATAWQDPQYQAEITKSGNRWLCLNCHTPLLSQMDFWPVGLQGDDVELPLLVANPGFDEDLRNESITCAVCHVRGDHIVGPGLNDAKPPHATLADPEWLRGAEVCLSCHQAEAVYPGKSFICTFQTGDEWRSSPAHEQGKTCVDCHMPIAERPAATGGPVRKVRRHTWRGAGMPKVKGRYPPDDANVYGLALTGTFAGEELVLEVSNANAGHMLPTGDPERWVQVDVTLFAGDEVVKEEQLRFGQTWEWSPVPKKLADNRLAPGEVNTHRWTVPAGTTRALVVASNHRISKENAEYHHLGDYPRSVETHRVTVER